MSRPADTPTANGSDELDGVPPAVRDRATQILEQNPDLSPEGFAGKMLNRTSLSWDTATALYADLVDDPDAGLSGAHEGGSDERAESRAERDPMPAPGETPDRDEHDESGSEGRREGDANTEPADDVAALIEDHYDRLEGRDVYATLGELAPDVAGTDTALSCIGNQDFTGWYRSRDAGGSWDGRGRPWALAKEFDDILEGAPTNPYDDGLERTLYATVNYTAIPWFMDSWDRYEWVEKGDDERKRVWEGPTSPTPEYDALHAYAPFADVDLADDVKADRPAGDVPVDDLEDALERYIEAFADLAGGREHVFALDSVGGAYVMVAPTSTAPIAGAFDRDDRAALFDELTDRLNEWLEGVAEEVTDATGLSGVFEPDLLNNKNRLYKAPLSVHSSLDGVVTPVDRTAPEYDFTPLEDAGSDLIDETSTWVDGFTADHRDAVESIVATLWPEYYADADTWQDALAAWLEDRREAERETQQRERERERVRAEDIPDDLETTDDIDVIESKIEDIDVQEIAEDLADDWDTDPGRDPPRFAAPWHATHNSGTSCFATEDKFVDIENNGNGGGALHFVALERGIIRNPGDRLTGTDYWDAVNALRDEGYNIPYYEGSNGRHPDVLRLFTEPDGQEEKKKQLARALFADR